MKRVVGEDAAKGVAPGGAVVESDREAAAGIGVFPEDGEVAVDAGEAHPEGFEQGQAAAFGDGGKNGGASGGVEFSYGGVGRGFVEMESGGEVAAEGCYFGDDRRAEVGVDAANEVELEREAGAPEVGADIEEETLVFAGLEDAEAEEGEGFGF